MKVKVQNISGIRDIEVESDNNTEGRNAFARVDGIANPISLMEPTIILK